MDLREEIKRYNVAEFAHIELYTPKLEESAQFFVDFLGMDITDRSENSIYMNCYQERVHHSLKLTQNPIPGVGHIGLRTSSAAALDRVVEDLEAAGYKGKWTDGDKGHGKAYEILDHDSHVLEFYWEQEKLTTPEDFLSSNLNRPKRRPRRGVPVRKLDHCNLMAQDVKANADLFHDILGFRISENIVKKDGTQMGSWLSCSSSVNEVVYSIDEGTEVGNLNRIHHTAFMYGETQHLFDVAELFVENGYVIDAGPLKHGITQSTSLYVFEPGGNRIEVYGFGGYSICEPDWETVTWDEERVSDAIIFFGQDLPADFFQVGTPDVADAIAALDKA